MEPHMIELRKYGLRLDVEILEERITPGHTLNGQLAIIPPGGGQGHETIHLHPQQGVIGLRTAEAQSGGVVNWEVTRICDSPRPGETGRPCA